MAYLKLAIAFLTFTALVLFTIFMDFVLPGIGAYTIITWLL